MFLFGQGLTASGLSMGTFIYSIWFLFSLPFLIGLLPLPHVLAAFFGML